MWFTIQFGFLFLSKVALNLKAPLKYSSEWIKNIISSHNQKISSYLAWTNIANSKKTKCEEEYRGTPLALLYTKRQSSFVHNCFVILYRVFIANIRGRGHVSQNFTSPSSMQILPWWRLLILKKMCHDRLFSWSHCIVSNIKTLQKACHIFIIASLKTSLITEKLAKVYFSKSKASFRRELMDLSSPK